MRCGVEHVVDEMIERRGVGLDGGGERQALALAHDGDAVISQCAADQHLVTGAADCSGELHARGHLAHAGGVDVDAVRAAALDHLGVAGDDGDARLARGLRHGVDDRSQVRHGVPLFQDEAAGEVAYARAGGGDVVDGAAHGEPADVAAGEELRRDYKAIR